MAWAQGNMGVASRPAHQPHWLLRPPADPSTPAQLVGPAPLTPSGRSDL